MVLAALHRHPANLGEVEGVRAEDEDDGEGREVVMRSKPFRCCFSYRWSESCQGE
jgi:hypothetical protein